MYCELLNIVCSESDLRGVREYRTFQSYVQRGVADSSRRWFVLRRQTVSVFFVFIVIRASKARDVKVA